MDDRVCQTCLSKDRRLIPQRSVCALFQEINIWQAKNLNGGICWECHSLLVKFKKFKEQVHHAWQSVLYETQDQKTLSRLSKETKTRYDYEFVDNSDPLTNEEGTDNEIIKIEFDKFDKSDSRDNCEEKTEFDNIDSVKDFFGANNDVFAGDVACEDEKPNLRFKFDEKIITNLTVDDIPIKSNYKSINELNHIEILQPKIQSLSKRRKKKVNNKINKETRLSDEKEVKKKIAAVICGVDEILKHREEKRGQPNFKKLPFKCDSCVLGFVKKDAFDYHVKMKHSEKAGQYVCDICDIRFPTKKRIERHCRKHFMYYRCRLCKFATVEQWSALSHCRSKHSADQRNRIHCGQCEKVVRTPEDLEVHMKTKHSVLCNECGEKFIGKHTLRAHLARIHSAKREFVCDMCGRTYLSKTRLESHMVTHNPAIARQLAYCEICKVQYKNLYVLRNHLKNGAAHAERTYSCPECNKKFVSKIYYNKHYNFFHLQKSDYSCKLCNKLFISEWRLKIHNQTQHGSSRQRDHACNVCGKKFYTQSTLRAHQLTHSAQRSYMCEDCGDTFKQRPALYTHTKLVHKGLKRKRAS